MYNFNFNESDMLSKSQNENILDDLEIVEDKEDFDYEDFVQQAIASGDIDTLILINELEIEDEDDDSLDNQEVVEDDESFSIVEKDGQNWKVLSTAKGKYNAARKYNECITKTKNEVRLVSLKDLEKINESRKNEAPANSESLFTALMSELNTIYKCEITDEGFLRCTDDGGNFIEIATIKNTDPVEMGMRVTFTDGTQSETVYYVYDNIQAVNDFIQAVFISEVNAFNDMNEVEAEEVQKEEKEDVELEDENQAQEEIDKNVEEESEEEKTESLKRKSKNESVDVFDLKSILDDLNYECSYVTDLEKDGELFTAWFIHEKDGRGFAGKQIKDANTYYMIANKIERKFGEKAQVITRQYRYAPEQVECMLLLPITGAKEFNNLKPGDKFDMEGIDGTCEVVERTEDGNWECKAPAGVGNDYTYFDLYVEDMDKVTLLNESLKRKSLNEDVIPAVYDSLIIRYKDKHDRNDFDEIVKILKDLRKTATFITDNDIREDLEGWRYSEEDIDEIINTIKVDKNESKSTLEKLKRVEDEVRAEIEKIYGDDKDLMEYFFVESRIEEGYYDDGSDMNVIEVRAELSYDDMGELAEKLDKVVQKYDEYAYFDRVTGGIMDAVIDFDRKHESLNETTVIDNGKEFKVDDKAFDIVRKNLLDVMRGYGWVDIEQMQDYIKEDGLELTDEELIAVAKNCLKYTRIFDASELQDTNLQDIKDAYGTVIVVGDFKRLPKHESLNESDDKFNYMMLDRLRTDCEYFLGNGNGYEKHLWAGNVEDQIAEMRKIYDKLPEKPEWLSLEDIDRYEKEMLAKRDSKNEVKEITRDEWNKTPKDYKMIKDGKPYLVYLDDKTHATVLGPCKIIDESLNEDGTVSDMGVAPIMPASYDDIDDSDDELFNITEGFLFPDPEEESDEDKEEEVNSLMGAAIEDINQGQPTASEWIEDAQYVFNSIKDDTVKNRLRDKYSQYLESKKNEATTKPFSSVADAVNYLRNKYDKQYVGGIYVDDSRNPRYIYGNNDDGKGYIKIAEWHGSPEKTCTIFIESKKNEASAELNKVIKDLAANDKTDVEKEINKLYKEEPDAKSNVADGSPILGATSPDNIVPTIDKAIMNKAIFAATSYANNGPQMFAKLQESFKNIDRKTLDDLMNSKDVAGIAKYLYESEIRDNNLSLNVKNWYIKEFPEDELGEEIPENLTFKDINNNISNVYNLLEPADDSIVRERVFIKLAELRGVDYDTVYNDWLNESLNEDTFTDPQMNVVNSNSTTVATGNSPETPKLADDIDPAPTEVQDFPKDKSEIENTNSNNKEDQLAKDSGTENIPTDN